MRYLGLFLASCPKCLTPLAKASQSPIYIDSINIQSVSIGGVFIDYSIDYADVD